MASQTLQREKNKMLDCMGTIRGVHLSDLQNRIRQWIAERRRETRGKYVVYSAALAVAEAIKEKGWPLSRESVVSRGNQIRITGSKFRRIIVEALGEERASSLTFPQEGGRTTRSAPVIAQRFIEFLREHFPNGLTEEERKRLADCLEKAIAEDYEDYVRSWSAIRLPKPSPHFPLSQFVHQLLVKAGENRGAVAHHLVGAKLALRFPNYKTSAHEEGLQPRPFTAADHQKGAPGDYWYKNTSFHVTISPSVELFEKCRNNLAEGWRVWVVTTRENLERARNFADAVEDGLSTRIQIVAISDFVGQNLEELGDFSFAGVEEEAEALIAEYNARIDEAENGNPTLKIEFGV